jgi:hypothetical protein
VTGETEPVSMGRYAGIYMAVVVGFAVLIVALAIVFPEIVQKYGKSAAISTKFVAVMITYQMFIKKHLRLLSKEEYWQLVAYCSALTFVWEAFLFSAMILLGTIPMASAASTLLIFVVVAVLTSCIMPIIGFSNRLGNVFLQAYLKRQIIAASKG